MSLRGHFLDVQAGPAVCGLSVLRQRTDDLRCVRERDDGDDRCDDAQHHYVKVLGDPVQLAQTIREAFTRVVEFHRARGVAHGVPPRWGCDGQKVHVNTIIAQAL